MRALSSALPIASTDTAMIRKPTPAASPGVKSLIGQFTPTVPSAGSARPYPPGRMAPRSGGGLGGSG